MAVGEIVSLRDLPATIVDLVGLSAGAPFPGRSMARRGVITPLGAVPAAAAGDGAMSELAEPNPTNPSLGLSPAARGPLSSLAEGIMSTSATRGMGESSYSTSGKTRTSCATGRREEAMQPVVQRMRQRLDRMKPRPC